MQWGFNESLVAQVPGSISNIELPGYSHSYITIKKNMLSVIILIDFEYGCSKLQGDVNINKISFFLMHLVHIYEY